MVRTRCSKGEDGHEGRQLPLVGVQTRSMKRKLNEDAAAKQGSSSSARVGVDDLKEILKERKAESKRLGEIKRLEGLEKIRERKAKNGVEPLEHFPKEVWCLILDELTPSDKANIWQIHPLFSGLLEKNRIRDILFPLVLDHDTRFILKYLDRFDQWWRSTLNTTLLELRRVSRSMRNAIDKWFEDDLLAFTSPHMKTASRIYSSWDWYKKPIHLQMTTFDEAELQKIQDIRNPAKIFKRDIIVDIVNPVPVRPYGPQIMALDEDERICYFNLFVANVTQMLEDIGDQIWRFKLNCREMDGQGVFSPQVTQVYSLLKEWCSLLPNVKLIDIFFHNPFSAYGSSSDNISSMSNEGFPALHALKRLDFYSYGNPEVLELIGDAIVSSNPQIKMIHCNRNSDYEFMSRPSIKTLELELCELRVDGWPVLFKKIERDVGNFNWNLKILKLSFNGMGKAVSIQSLIQLLNRFPKLETLFVNNYSVKFSDEEIDFLRLPNLTRFGISFMNVYRRKYDGKTHFFFSLQFLLHSSKLETLSWSDNSFTKSSGLSRSLYTQILSYEAEHPEEMLDFGGGFNDLDDSSLWDAFPHLKVIEVKIRGIEMDEIFRKSQRFLSSSP